MTELETTNKRDTVLGDRGQFLGGSAMERKGLHSSGRLDQESEVCRAI